MFQSCCCCPDSAPTEALETDGAAPEEAELDATADLAADARIVGGAEFRQKGSGRIRVIRFPADLAAFLKELAGKRLLHLRGYTQGYQQLEQKDAEVAAEQKQKAIDAMIAFNPDYIVVDGEVFGSGFQYYAKACMETTRAFMEPASLIWVASAADRQTRRAESWADQGFTVTVCLLPEDQIAARLDNTFGTSASAALRPLATTARGGVRLFADSARVPTWSRSLHATLRAPLEDVETRSSAQYFEKSSFEAAARSGAAVDLFRGTQGAGELWTYTPANGLPICTREVPEINGRRTGKTLEVDDTFRVIEEKKVGSVTFLRLAGGEGWLFDSNPDVGLMCTKVTALEGAGELWTYTPANGLPICTREVPEINGTRTGKTLEVGDMFRVIEEKKVGSVTFLRLAGGEGWLFDGNPDVGLMCTKVTALEGAAAAGLQGVMCIGGGESTILELGAVFMNGESGFGESDVAIFPFIRVGEPTALQTHVGGSFCVEDMGDWIRQISAGTACSGKVPMCPVDEDKAVDAADEKKESGAVSKKSSTLGVITQNWRRAVVGEASTATALVKTPLLLGSDGMVDVLNALSKGLGDYLKADLEKVRKSKAPELEDGDDYKQWLLGEMPVHAATRYRGYVDDSAFMGQLWVGRQLEFWVEVFAGLKAGKGTKEAADVAYQGTLKKHHGFMQVAAFTGALKGLPDRQALMGALQGEAENADFAADLEEFVSLGRPIAKYMLVLDKEIDGLRAQEQKNFGKKK